MWENSEGLWRTFIIGATGSHLKDSSWRMKQEGLESGNRGSGGPGLAQGLEHSSCSACWPKLRETEVEWAVCLWGLPGLSSPYYPKHPSSSHPTVTYLECQLSGQLSERIHFLQTSPCTFLGLCCSNSPCRKGFVRLHTAHPGADHWDGREVRSASPRGEHERCEVSCRFREPDQIIARELANSSLWVCS